LDTPNKGCVCLYNDNAKKDVKNVGDGVMGPAHI